MTKNHSAIVAVLIVAAAILLSIYAPLYAISIMIQSGWITWPMDMAPSAYHPVTTTLSLARAAMVFLLAPLLYILVCDKKPLLSAFKLGQFPSVLAISASVIVIIAGKKIFGFHPLDSSSLYGTEFTVLYYMVATILLAPLLEELFFRGFVHEIFSFLKTPVLILTSAVIFSMFHYTSSDPKQLMWLFILGGICGALRVSSGGVLWPVLLHCLNNALVFVWA